MILSKILTQGKGLFTKPDDNKGIYDKFNVQNTKKEKVCILLLFCIKLNLKIKKYEVDITRHGR